MALGDARLEGRAGPDELSVAEVLAVWQDVLGLADVRPDDDFFAVGGQSLTAVQLSLRLYVATGRRVSARDVFRCRTPAALARVLAERPPRAEGDSPAPSGVYPLAMAQEPFVAIEEVMPGAPLHITQSRFELVGSVDPATLLLALGDVACRHDALRTRLERTEAGWSQVVDQGVEVEVVELDLAADDDTPAGIEQRITPYREVGFIVGTRPMYRVLVLYRPGGTVLLVFMAHHVVFDGWSREILARELAAAYAARAAGGALAAVPATAGYGPFAARQRAEFDRATIERYVDYWDDALSDITPVDFGPGEPSVEERYLYESFRGAVPADAWGPLAQLGAHTAATRYMTLFAAFAVVLRSRFGVTRPTVCTMVANRDDPETADVIGNFANTLVLRVDCADDPTFRDLLARTRASLLAAYEHQDLPFEQVVEELGRRGRDLAGAFQVGLALHAAGSAIDTADVVLRPAEGARLRDQEINPSTFDITIELRETADGLAGPVQARTASVPRPRAEAIVADLVAVCRAAAADPDARLSSLLPGDGGPS